MDVIRQTIGRVDNMLTFTLVNFFTKVLRASLDTHELTLVSLSGTVLFFPFQFLSVTGKLEQAVQQIFALTLSNTIISNFQPSGRVTLWVSLNFVFMSFP